MGDAFDPSTQTAVPDPLAIRRSAMDLLARREHGQVELIRKLSRRFPVADVEAAVSRLADEKLQSDERFSESYIRARSSRGYGSVRIREELLQKGVDRSAMEEAMQGLSIDWLAVATSAYEKKYANSEPDGLQERAARSRFLAYRGFSAEQIRRLLGDRL